jgi:hypothetical protein
MGDDPWDEPPDDHPVWAMLEDADWAAVQFLAFRGWADEPDTEQAIAVLALRLETGLNPSHVADLYQEIKEREGQREWPRWLCLCGRALVCLGGTLGPYFLVEDDGLFGDEVETCPTCGRDCKTHVQPPEAQPQLAMFGVLDA